MDAKKIVIASRRKNQWGNPFLPESTRPEFDHLRHRFRCLFGGNSFETNPAATIGVSLHDVHLLLLVATSIPNLAAGKSVELFDRGFGNRKLCAAFVDELQGVAISAHLFLI